MCLYKENEWPCSFEMQAEGLEVKGHHACNSLVIQQKKKKKFKVTDFLLCVCVGGCVCVGVGGCTCDMRKFPGQEMNLSHSCDLSHCRENARSLTH